MTTTNQAYGDTTLLINGEWRGSSDGATIPVLDPATGEEIGRVSKASRADLDAAVAAAPI